MDLVFSSRLRHSLLGWTQLWPGTLAKICSLASRTRHKSVREICQMLDQFFQRTIVSFSAGFGCVIWSSTSTAPGPGCVNVLHDLAQVISLLRYWCQSTSWQSRNRILRTLLLVCFTAVKTVRGLRIAHGELEQVESTWTGSVHA